MRQAGRDDNMNVTVVIDAFRAVATAAYILHQRHREYLLTSTSASARRLAAADSDALLVGKPEIGAWVAYNIPNSPTRVVETRIAGRHVVHRTEAGARGVLAADGRPGRRLRERGCDGCVAAPDACARPPLADGTRGCFAHLGGRPLRRVD